jgi:hypothetical protein
MEKRERGRESKRKRGKGRRRTGGNDERTKHEKNTVRVEKRWKNEYTQRTDRQTDRRIERETNQMSQADDN